MYILTLKSTAPLIHIDREKGMNFNVKVYEEISDTLPFTFGYRTADALSLYSLDA